MNKKKLASSHSRLGGNNLPKFCRNARGACRETGRLLGLGKLSAAEPDAAVFALVLTDRSPRLD